MVAVPPTSTGDVTVWPVGGGRSVVERIARGQPAGVELAAGGLGVREACGRGGAEQAATMPDTFASAGAYEAGPEHGRATRRGRTSLNSAAEA